MSTALHHTRLALAVEFADPPPRRILERDSAMELGGHIATDLARAAPATRDGFLTVSAAMLDTTDLLRPGFSTYTALETLAQQSGAGLQPGQVMSIGGKHGRMPREELMPRARAPALMMAVPLLLTLPADRGPACRRQLEETLFDHGGAHPPTLAALAEHTGARCVHAQLITLFDLIALNRVQLNAAGLGLAAEALQHALLQPEEPATFRHSAGLTIQWNTTHRHAELTFLTWEHWPNRHDQSLDTHGSESPPESLDTHRQSLDTHGSESLDTHRQSLDTHGSKSLDTHELDDRNSDTHGWLQWLRAQRQTENLLRSHGVAVTITLPAGDTRAQLDARAGHVEFTRPGTIPGGAVLHQHPELGILARTESHGGHSVRRYPLSETAARRMHSTDTHPATMTVRMDWPGNDRQDP